MTEAQRCLILELYKRKVNCLASFLDYMIFHFPHSGINKGLLLLSCE